MALPAKLSLTSVLSKLGPTATPDDLLALLLEERLTLYVDFGEQPRTEKFPREYWSAWKAPDFARCLLGRALHVQFPYTFLCPEKFEQALKFQRAIAEKSPLTARRAAKYVPPEILSDPRFIGWQSKLMRLVSRHRALVQKNNIRSADEDACRLPVQEFDLDDTPESSKSSESAAAWSALDHMGSTWIELLRAMTTPSQEPYVNAVEFAALGPAQDTLVEDAVRWIASQFPEKVRGEKLTQLEVEDKWKEQKPNFTRDHLRAAYERLRPSDKFPVKFGRPRGKPSRPPRKLRQRES